MSKFCTKCGNQISDDSVFCNKCGVKFEWTDINKSGIGSSEAIEENNYAQGDVVLNSEPQRKKKKIGKRLYLLLGIVLVLVVIIITGVIAVPSLQSSDHPKIISFDKDSYVFDLTFDQFKKGFANCIEPVWTLSDYSSKDINVNDYIAAFNSDDNWYSWDDGNAKMHKWTYKWSDSLSYDITVEVDNDSGKITKISSTSYYPDIITKMILTTYIVFGNKNINDNIESVYNLMCLLEQLEDLRKVAVNIDNLILFPDNSKSEYEPTYYYFAPTSKLLEDASDAMITLSYDDLPHFDRVLSARYGIDFKWQVKE